MKKPLEKHTLVKTTHRGHAVEIGKTTDLSSYDAIISISGDGLFHELINGLLQREDGKDKIPVGLIPAGSGNGLVNSFVSESPLVDARSYAMFQMLKFDSTPLDLIYFQSEEIIRYCMLSVMVGLVADIDHESDKLRMLGAIRKTGLIFILLG